MGYGRQGDDLFPAKTTTLRRIMDFSNLLDERTKIVLCPATIVP